MLLVGSGRHAQKHYLVSQCFNFVQFSHFAVFLFHSCCNGAFVYEREREREMREEREREIIGASTNEYAAIFSFLINLITALLTPAVHITAPTVQRKCFWSFTKKFFLIPINNQVLSDIYKLNTSVSFSSRRNKKKWRGGRKKKKWKNDKRFINGRNKI